MAVSGSLPGTEWEEIPPQPIYLVYHVRKGCAGKPSVDVLAARDKQHASRVAAMAFPESDILRVCRDRGGIDAGYPDARFINGQFLAFLAGEERSTAAAK